MLLGLLVLSYCARAVADGAARVWDGAVWHDIKAPLGFMPVDGTRPQPPQPPASARGMVDGNPTIFVGISAFRDARCGLTLAEVFGKAKHPSRVRVGVYDQVKTGEDPGCLAVYCREMMKKVGRCPYEKQVRLLVADYAKAAGPVVARAAQQSLLDPDDEFCLQVDAHTMLLPDWDEKLLGEWRSTLNEHAVLSTYVRRVSEYDQNVNGRWEVPHLCKTVWSINGLVRNADAGAATWLPLPKLTPLWGAGMSFSKCHAERRVPYDPRLKQVFDGEEFSRAMRLWTHGYDVFTPSRAIVYHDYDGDMFKSIPESSHQWNFEPPPARDPEAKARDVARSEALLRTLFHLAQQPGRGAALASKEALGKWGLGSERSYSAWVSFSGVDGARHQPASGAQCGDVAWVPPRSAHRSGGGWITATGKSNGSGRGGGGGGGAFGRKQGVATILVDAADEAFEAKNDAFLAAQEHTAVRHNR